MNDMNNVSWPGWEVVRKIGNGSFGSVYEIQRDVFGDVERAALKVITIPQSRSDIDELLNEGYDEASVTERFRGYLQDIAREYSLMAKMKGHTNVVYCDDIRYVEHKDSIGWDIYIKMELLTPMMNTLSNDIPPETAIRVGKDLCSALILCKQNNVVHRDIKPQNIFVSANGEYKLGDFGIAKTAEKTTGGTKIGTYKYMAPEVYNNQPYGAAADIYSLGLVLYWLLNHRRTPFLPLPPKTPTASVEEEARRRRFSGEQLPPPANGSDALKAIVMKACAYDMRDRYTSAEEMLADLKALEQGRTPVAAPVFAAAVADEGTVGAFGRSAAAAEDATVGPFSGRAAAEDATVGPMAGRAAVTNPAPAASKPQPVKTPPVVTPPVRQSQPMDEDATVGPMAGRAAMDSEATIGSKVGSQKKQKEAPKVAEPVKAKEDKADEAPVKEAAEKPAEKKEKKKILPFILIGAGVALAALAIVLIVTLGGGKGQNPAAVSGNNSGAVTDAGATITDEKPAIEGTDIFNGLRFDEMVWGAYEADCYDYNGSKDDSLAFREGMQYVDIEIDGTPFNVAPLPVSMEFADYSYFCNSFYYDDRYYDLYTTKGRVAFRKAYSEEMGDMTEEQFNNLNAFLDMNWVEFVAVDKIGSAYYFSCTYTIQDNTLAFYLATLNDDYTVTVESNPIIEYDFLMDGSKLSLMYDGVQRDYLIQGYKESDSMLNFCGCVVNDNNRYQNIESISYMKADDYLSTYVKLSNEEDAVDPVMELNNEDGSFTLSWQEKWTIYNGKHIKEADPQTITGKIIPCNSYNNDQGFIMIIDGNCYRYQMCTAEYEDRLYGDMLDDSVSAEDLSDSQKEDLAATKESILEELDTAFQNAGIDAEIDPKSGKVTLESNFLFARSSSELSAEGQAYLNGFLDVYSAIVLSDTYASSIANIVIEGHTDTNGSYNMNLQLSEDRANSVATHCISRNAALASVIQTKGCSYDFPIYNADGTVNMDQSRRVTFRFILSVD